MGIGDDLQSAYDRDVKGEGNSGPVPQDALSRSWDLATSGYKAYLVGDLGGAGGVAGYDAAMKSTQAPPVTTPGTTQPTLADTNTLAVQQTLGSERQAASASSILTGGAGLLDMPTTSSRTLLGS